MMRRFFLLKEAEQPEQLQTRAEQRPQVRVQPRQDENTRKQWVSEVGQHTQALRYQLDEVYHSFAAVDEIKRSFAALAQPFQKTLRDYEATEAARQEAETQLQREREGHESLKQQFADLSERLQKTTEERGWLNSQNQHLQQSLRHTESKLASVETEMRSQSATLADFDRQLSAEMAQTKGLTEDNQNLREQLSKADEITSRLEVEIRELKEDRALSQEESRTFSTSLNEALANGVKLGRKLSEAEIALGDIRAREIHLEGTVARIEAENIRLRAEAEDIGERYASEVSALTAKLDALGARSATAERLLNDTRTQLQERIDEARSADRKFLDSGLHVNALQTRLAKAEAELKKYQATSGDVELKSIALNEQTSLLQRTLSERESDLRLADEKVQTLETRLRQMSDEYRRERSHFERQLGELRRELDREKMDRSLAEGALETARQNRAKLLRQLSSSQDDQPAEAQRSERVVDYNEQVAEADADDDLASDNVHPLTGTRGP
jgi:crescentin